MIEFGGILYYIDLDKLGKTITPSDPAPTESITVVERKTVLDNTGKILSVEVFETVTPRTKEIDGAKYDTIRMMIELLIDYNDDSDPTLGADRALDKTPLAYKIAFNTLHKCGVLKAKEQQ